jgi:GIY-YIG catalytic domain
MTSGIYQLNFNNQAYYVGQSQDMEIRWKQHADKFLKGKAAAKMQDAYRQLGMPRAQILIECHKDYLDSMENYYIHACKRHPNCLNTSVPKLDPSINYQWMLENPQMLKFSAFEIMSAYINNTHDHNKLKEEHDDLKHNFNKEYMLHKATIQLRDGKDENEELVKTYHSRLHAAQDRLNKLNNRGFFGRLFNYD